jgi:hypothetical protein
MLGKIGDKDLRENIIRVYGSAKSLFDYLNYYCRQSDTGKDAQIDELEQKIRAQIEKTQKLVTDVQKNDPKISRLKIAFVRRNTRINTWPQPS